MKVVVVLGILVAAAVVWVAISLRANGDGPVFTFQEVETAFDAAGLEVEPAEELGVFLEPTGDENFSVVVFDDADEAEWSYDELERMRQGGDATEAGLILRRRNVLVHSDRDVSQATRRKIDQALTQLGTIAPGRAAYSAWRPTAIGRRASRPTV